MIATILKSSSSFSAVRYNERKVENGVAELVVIRNFGYLQDAPDMRGITSLRNYLMDYSARNDRTRMTQFHAAISCKGSEYSKEAGCCDPPVHHPPHHGCVVTVRASWCVR